MATAAASYMMGGGYGCGPGMMYGYGLSERSYQRGDNYRGRKLCWCQTGENRGYYVPCTN